jgi:hypothetical protein
MRCNWQLLKPDERCDKRASHHVGHFDFCTEHYERYANFKPTIEPPPNRECPLCQSGTVEIMGDEAFCRGNCGNKWKVNARTS